MENQTQDLSYLTNQFDDFRKENENKKKKKSKDEILAQYFNPRREREIFRILPVKRGKKFYDEAYFHNVAIITTGGKVEYKAVYCLARNEPKIHAKDSDGKLMYNDDGTPKMVLRRCPLCEKHKSIMSKQDTSIKYIKKEKMTAEQLQINENNKKIFADASKWEAKKYYIIKGIDRGAEKDGPKFWRFKHNFKKQGPMDKLMPVLNEYVRTQQADFMSPVNGTDLTIMMDDVLAPNGKPYKAVSTIITRGQSTLHNDEPTMRDWLSDTKTWRDVFQPKKAPVISEVEYLEMVAEGKNPYFDEHLKKWVFPGRPDLEEKANTRTMDLDEENEDVAMASDIDDSGTYIVEEVVEQKPVQETPTNNVEQPQPPVEQPPVEQPPVEQPAEQPKQPVEQPQPPVEQPAAPPVQQENKSNPDDPYGDLPF